MKEKGSRIADEIISQMKREKQFREYAKRKKEMKEKDKQNKEK